MMQHEVERSKSLLERSRQILPGGVNSPVRACNSVGGTPFFAAEATGSRIRDVDGNEYVDYVLSYGPGILGHADPDVVAAVCEAAGRGLSFGAPTEAEAELGEAIVAALQAEIRVDHTHERQQGKVVALGDDLGADDDVGVAAGDARDRLLHRRSRRHVGGQ